MKRKRISKPLESVKSKSHSLWVNANVWQTLIAPFVGDVKTLVSVRRVCCDFRCLTGPNVAKQIPIGPFSLKQYENICGAWRSTSNVYVDYLLQNSRGPIAQREKHNIRTWRKQSRFSPPPAKLIQCDLQPFYGDMTKEPIAYSHFVSHIFIQPKQYQQDGEIIRCVGFVYHSGNVHMDEVVIYLSRVARLYEYLPHSHVIVKCNTQVPLLADIYNKVKKSWKLTFAFHGTVPTEADFMLRTNATEVLLQNWQHIPIYLLVMPRVRILTLDYRRCSWPLFESERDATNFIIKLFTHLEKLEKIILLCDHPLPCVVTYPHVEVHLQSSIPIMTVEEEYQ